MENEINFTYEDIKLSMPEKILNSHKFGNYYKNRANTVIFNEKIKRLIIKDLINKKYIDNSKNILDCGAFIGNTALPVSKMINGTIYAIDPSNKNLNLITKLAECNNIKNIITYDFALSDKKEILYTNGVMESNCVFQSNKKTNNYKPPHNLPHGSIVNNSVKVKATTIDDLYKEKKIENLSMLHLDLEGFEYAALKSSKITINAEKPLIIWENHIDILNKETRKLEYKQIGELLRTYNYSSYIINEASGGNPNCRNFISICEENKNKFESCMKDYINANTLIKFS